MFTQISRDDSFGEVMSRCCQAQGKKAVAVSVMSLSNRMFTEPIEPHEDRIHSLKDDEWNKKILEFLSEGRLEDVGQLSEQYTTKSG